MLIPASISEDERGFKGHFKIYNKGSKIRCGEGKRNGIRKLIKVDGTMNNKNI